MRVRDIMRDVRFGGRLRVCARRPAKAACVFQGEGKRVRFESAPLSHAAAEAYKKGRRLEGRAGDIMQAARGLFEAKGVAATTVKDIAAEAGITRELFYYYFAGKNGVVAAVLDDYVADIVESVAVWNETRTLGDMPAALRDCMATLRRTLYDASGPRPMIAVLEELGMRDAFDVRAVRETAEFLCRNVADEYERYHDVEIDLLFEMFCVMLFGLVGLLKIDPAVSDDTLMKVVEQTLRLDMGPLSDKVPCAASDTSA